MELNSKVMSELISSYSKQAAIVAQDFSRHAALPVGHRPSLKPFHTVLSPCLSVPSIAQAIIKDFPYRPVSLSFSSQWSTGHNQRLSIPSCLLAFQLPVQHRPSPKPFHTVLSLSLSSPSGAEAITKAFPHRPVSLPFSSQWSTVHHQRLSIPSCLLVFHLPVEQRPSPKPFHTVLSLCLSAPSGAQSITKDFPHRPVSLPFSSQWSRGHHQSLSTPSCLFAFQLPVEQRPSPCRSVSLPFSSQVIIKGLSVDKTFVCL
ncbi:hypothetical protein PoB_001128500 [Plakobranchus ocellatus]|uniref:Uncharacterized protein n=1 Tax=Plakobranchus ocellatus TaxID=259542 RepID=A0AAV3YPZ4_9GAST|nr:hypothetical protein PoB_001128500 [Plakobranchus ocellatus]